MRGPRGETMAKLEKTKKALDLVSKAYQTRVILGFGTKKRRKLLNEAKELIDEEIEGLKDDQKLVKALRFVSKAISTWFDEVGLKYGSSKMHQLIQNENENWRKAAESLKKFSEDGILKKINGWRFQSEAQLHQRIPNIEEACIAWQKAGKFFLEAGEMVVASDMYLNVAIFLERTLERPGDAIKILSEVVEEFVKSKHYRLAGELNHYVGNVYLNNFRKYREANKILIQSTKMYWKAHAVIPLIYIVNDLFVGKNLEALHYVYRKTFYQIKRRLPKIRRT